MLSNDDYFRLKVLLYFDFSASFKVIKTKDFNNKTFTQSKKKERERESNDDHRFLNVSQPNENIFVSLLLSFENWSLSCKYTSSIQTKTRFVSIVQHCTALKGKNEQYRKLHIWNTCSGQASWTCHSRRAQQTREKKCNELGILEVRANYC